MMPLIFLKTISVIVWVGMSLSFVLFGHSAYANEGRTIEIESIAINSTQNANTTQNNPPNAQVYFDIQRDLSNLQREMGQLRGVLEELTYKLAQMEQSQEQRYLDLDKRVLTLSQNNHINQDNGSNTNGFSGTDNEKSTNNNSINLSNNLASKAQQQEAYKQAFDYVKQQEYAQSIEAFKSFLQQYPDSTLAANAHYWLGEVYLVEKRHQEALSSFDKVINDFSQHRKVPDALYKAGRSSALLNKPDLANVYYDKVLKRFPDSSAARLALTAQKR